VFAPLLILIFLIGFVPRPFIERAQPALEHTLAIAARRAELGRALAAEAGGPTAAAPDPGPAGGRP